MQYFLYGFVVFLIIGFGTATYIRNSVWSSQKSLWEDSLEKSDTMRAWHNLGFHYYGKKGLRQIEKNMYMKAIEKLNMTRISGSMNTYTNLANIFYQDNEIDKAEYYFKKSLEFLTPDSFKGHKIYMGLSLIEAQRHDYDKALEYICEAINKVPLVLYYNLKGIILMRLTDKQNALKNFRQGIKLEPYRWEGYFYVGAFLTELGHYQRGFWFLKQASQKSGVDYVKVTLYMIHNRLMADDQNRSLQYADSLLKDVSYGEIIKKITHIKATDHASIPLDVKSILDVIEKKFLNKTKQVKAGLIGS